jgi:two-component system sensor histidine kinase/response regulator
MLQDKIVLVVDDDLTLNEMYQNRLKSEGAIILVARDGEEGIRMAEENHPHIILLDLMMPKFNGFEVLKALKDNPETKDIPIVVQTVLLEADKYEKAKALGATDYIVKADVMPGDVVAKVSKILDNSSDK